MMTGACTPAWRAALSTEKPSRPGSMTSRTNQIVGLTLDEQLESAVAIGGGLHGMPLFHEPLPDEARDLTIVLHDQNTHGVSGPSYSQLPRPLNQAGSRR